MRLALIGTSISHSLSPQIYREIFKCDLRYDLLDISNSSHLPSIKQLRENYHGVNITSPFKQYYLDDVIIESTEVAKLGAINTISFTPEGSLATNTDLMAVEKILQQHLKKTDEIYLTILGSGVMARLSILVAEKFQIPYKQLDRQGGLNESINLRPFYLGKGHFVINACSRKFSFKGDIHPESIFWDFNYNYHPHQQRLPGLVKSYFDGRELLYIQAQLAAEFWQRTNPKLKC
jgi:shikimate 5-dehydrogenase